MTLQRLPSEFPYIWGKFNFLFISVYCTRTFQNFLWISCWWKRNNVLLLIYDDSWLFLIVLAERMGGGGWGNAFSSFFTHPKVHRKKKVREFPVPCRDVITKLSLGGNNDVRTELFRPRGSLVSDIPAGDGKLVNLFLRCTGLTKQIIKVGKIYFLMWR